MVVDRAGDTDTPRLGEGLQTGGDVDPVSEDLVLFFYDIPEVDAHAKLHLAGEGKFTVLVFQFLLYLYRTLEGIHHAGKLGKKVVSGGIHHPAMVLIDKGSHYFFVRGEGLEGARLILPHEAAVAFDIGTEDGGELTLDVL